ncbi:hypothetical protein MIND_00633700 [Mycena indigotica]|uniref:NAD(P)-binding protein n=1 Tax=Mycena indigotica TaxID=2126181 RepID=A0A8H6SQ94_9AGAR|nr:uncharacterized protein MIND_00633700 [Mycena indigotica]KAF7304025.1 hypothetical protein MIND_00633700 [Mycena indigotica]
MSSRIILVTGSNTGIGYELVHLLAAKGHTVYLASRKEAAGLAAVEKIKKEKGFDVKFVQLDTNDSKSVDTAAAKIKADEGRLDVLVNNAGALSIFLFLLPYLLPLVCAGIAEMTVQQSASEPSIPAIRNTIETNLIGLIQTTTVFLPLLRSSATSTQPAVILNVSTDMASNSFMASPKGYLHQTLAYNTSKAAANAYTIALAREMKDKGENVKVNAVTPGFTTTALNGFADGGKTPEQGAATMLPWILLESDGKTGAFGFDGGEFPW